VASFARQQRLDQQAADFNGLRLISPYLHDGVVTASLSVPASERTTVQAAKPLLRAALSGLVPDGLLSRSTKGNYSALHYRGIARNMDVLHDLLTGSRLAEIGLLDASSVRQTLTQAGRGVDVPLARLASVVAAEAWYRAHERRTRTRWTPVREDKACLATSWPLTSA
jgi:asparagine synthase (glutamine-hydrolysing)